MSWAFFDFLDEMRLRIIVCVIFFLVASGFRWIEIKRRYFYNIKHFMHENVTQIKIEHLGDA